VSRLSKALDAGRGAVKIDVRFSYCSDAALHESMEHRYWEAALAIVFALIVMPWLGWNWIKPKR